MVTLGKDCVDKITGFRGVATARTIYLHGPDRLCLECRKLKENGKSVTRWFDEERLETCDAPPSQA